MAISTELYGLKSAGTYRFEKDQSVVRTPNDVETDMRVMVGFSKVGPFNTIVRVDNTKQFTDIFGGIDRTLERRGCYFHRSCLAALSMGPIYCLNLLNLGDVEDSDTAVVDVKRFSTSFGQANLVGEAYPYAKMYNTSTFWTPSEEALLANVDANVEYKSDSCNDLLTFTNIGKSPVSILVRRASDYNSTAYNITLQEWYGKGNTPAYLNENSLVSDFFVDVFIFNGNWGADTESGSESAPYARLANDVKFSKYFDKDNGLRRKKDESDTTDTLFTQFLNEPDVKLLGSYSGCLLPGFIDKKGRNVYIEYLVNSDTATTGVMVAVNERIFTGNEMIDGVAWGLDLVGDTVDMSGSSIDVDMLSYKGSIDIADVSESIAIVEDETVGDNEFVVEVTEGESDLALGAYILGVGGNFSRIVKILGYNMENDETKYRKVVCQEEIVKDGGAVTMVKRFVDFFPCYQIFTLKGFDLKGCYQPNGTEERQEKILDMIAEDTPLFNALIDREMVRFRYLVDTFGLGIAPSCKSVYTKLCRARKSAFAIINAPSADDFSHSEDPSFTRKDGSVSAEFIAKGGDPDKNPTELFTLPDTVDGASWGAYYYPYLKVYSNYATLNIPPAAYVSNLFLAKNLTGTPWGAVAGERRGVISGNDVIGVEASLVRDSRDWLEPAGINAIIYRNGIGCEIYANKTAQQTPQSALSSISVREVCIYVQDNIERILENYLFESNNAQTRMEIKTLVDTFLDMVKANGGIADFRTVMDESNNTAEVIDRNMGVIDVYLEPVRAMEILVQRLTILRTGAIESGSFE